MKLKIIAIAFFITALSYVMSLQLTAAKAQENVASPLTSPITYFKHYIKGRVTYIYNRTVYPARNVSIYAINLNTNESKSTQTDKKGHYSLKLQDGKYKVYASDRELSRFQPESRTVDIRKHDTHGVDFHAFLNHAPILPE